MSSNSNDKHNQRAPRTSSEPASYEDVVEVRFQTSEETAELVSGVLFPLGCQGTIIDDFADETLLTAWLPVAALQSAISTLSGLEGVTAAIVRKERIDWLDNYEQSLVAIEIGTRFVIAPRADLVALSIGETDRIPLIVPQEQAFGTGGHESTAMCIELLESIDIEGKRCVDIGTGSGILAIAMAKLGAAKVFAFDNDVETWGVIDRNLERNAVNDGQISVFYASADALNAAAFEVATMNILPHVIKELLPHVIPSLADDAALIVSGILATQRDEFVTAIAQWKLTLRDELTSGEWWAGLLRK